MALHPAVAAVRRGVRAALAPLPPGVPVVVACSGGADSLALLAATLFEGHKAGLRVVGAVVDHGLQDDSAAHTARVVDQMAALGADETLSARVQVDPAGLGMEAAARRARYAVLGQVAAHVATQAGTYVGAGEGPARVLLGHTRDDQAETVLLGLARGSGGRSLAGMRRAFGPFVRPLLDVTRDDTVTACQVEGIAFWDDPHNADPGYARVRVRRTVLPVLEDQLGPGVAATLARTADQVRHDVDHLDDLAEARHAALAGPDGSLPVDALLADHPAIRHRVLRLAALAAGAPASELFHEHVLGLDALVTSWHGQKWVDLPGHLRARRVDGRIVITRA
ncbi:tRNA lysidine(34) synthetase TilS [Nocardioides marmotae]|uniref:tRNA lysidine(34) synthetase TilS n=1 Tax=Nocardioides marmotae TaxID=2663857 RepID=UPI0012B6290D|nr:tRNA lysidine(34) synthetase TilS [Nocardioides marmotae]MBC9732909.1 tRNA lysidine(34) synthetase TilS [Nocardioides marmotae]MTB84023.1 tRNA lysidine(34) synthetase TilS [Nocardioides marmotae]